MVLIEILKASGAVLDGAGIVIEKGFQNGGQCIRDLGVRLESIAIIDSMTCLLYTSVLSSDLSVCQKLRKPLVICNKTYLSVRCRVAVNSAKLCFLQPWGFIAYNLCVNHLGNMASDGIIGQCR